jgi:hypothetical protein
VQVHVKLPQGYTFIQPQISLPVSPGITSHYDKEDYYLQKQLPVYHNDILVLPELSPATHVHSNVAGEISISHYKRITTA